MNHNEYESLTPMERNCLRLARHDCKSEQIAHTLGIAASTVNAHVFAARRKLGGLPRLQAADRLRAYELDAALTNDGRHPQTLERGDVPADVRSSVSTPPHLLSRTSMTMAETPPSASFVAPPTEVREERATFVFDDVVLESGEQERRDARLHRVMTILAIAALTALVLIAAPAIYDSTAQRVANSLERPHAR